MLWTIAIVLITLWLLGLVSGDTTGSFIHIPLFFCIIAILIQIENDCRDDGTEDAGKRYLKRQSIKRSRKIVPKLNILSGE